MLPSMGEGGLNRHDNAFWEDGGHLNGRRVTRLREDELDNVKRECRGGDHLILVHVGVPSLVNRWEVDKACLQVLESYLGRYIIRPTEVV